MNNLCRGRIIGAIVSRTEGETEKRKTDHRLTFIPQGVKYAEPRKQRRKKQKIRTMHRFVFP